MDADFVEIIPQEEWEDTRLPKEPDEPSVGDAIFEYDNDYLDIDDNNI
jgi:hypothetical protein